MIMNLLKRYWQKSAPVNAKCLLANLGICDELWAIMIQDGPIFKDKAGNL